MNARSQRAERCLINVAFAASLGACIPSTATVVAPDPSPTRSNGGNSTVATPARTALPSTPPPAPMTAPALELPGHIRPGKPIRVTIPGYRAALVVHGKPGVTRAMIYLHGVCGNVQKIEDWTGMASNYVTTIALYGNKPCPTAPTRASWNQDIAFIHELIQTALGRVAEERAGQLDVHHAVLFGYSQGASRAERLVERYPEHYPWIILGGPPTPPRFERLRGARRSVILVGSEEHQEHLAGIAQELTTLGAPTEFKIFPGVGHGSFGRDAPRVMDETLSWLLEPPRRPTPASQ